ncbi:MAG TPA: pitrilysin family protein, partial [Verrucomicrobiae bacterium]|nr:pitrilysin family protein [Verrucomicrobiae bacterium]
LSANLLQPALPAEALQTLSPQLAAAVAGERESPGYLVRRALEKSLFAKNDPVQLETTPQTIKSVTLQSLQNYHQLVFRPDLTTIVVIGKIKPEEAAGVVGKYFGNWKAVGPEPNTLFPAASTNPPAFTQVPDASRVQDKVTLAQTLPLVRTNSDYYPLQLGNHVLGGGFYATRLYRDLRENAGLVYHVGTQLSVGQTRGTYAVEYACDPPNVSKARAIVLSNLQDMQRHNVSERELRQAKVLLLREIPLAESSADRIANGWLARSMLGLPLDEPVLAGHKYLKLTADDVRGAFARWIRPSSLVEVTQGPPPK